MKLKSREQKNKYKQNWNWLKHVEKLETWLFGHLVYKLKDADASLKHRKWHGWDQQQKPDTWQML